MVFLSCNILHVALLDLVLPLTHEPNIHCMDIEYAGCEYCMLASSHFFMTIG